MFRVDLQSLMTNMALLSVSVVSRPRKITKKNGNFQFTIRTSSFHCFIQKEQETPSRTKSDVLSSRI